MSADATSVTYTQQTSYYTKHTDGGDIFNNGGAEMGMWANSGNKKVVAWRKFKTAGNVSPGSGTDRALQIGDEFTITVNGDSPYGVLGISLNDGANTSSWADRHSNTRGYVETLSSYGNWYAYYSGGSQDSGSAPADDDNAVEFEITSSSTFNVRIKGGSWYYNLPMLNSPGASDLVDGYSIYYNDDYDGSGNQNAYWKQTTTVEDTGALHFGGSTAVTPGLITDGLDAASTSTVRTNKLYKFGSHTLTLTATNTYSGGTYIEEGVLAVDATGTMGSGTVEIGKTSEADTSELQINDTNGGKTVTNAITIVDAATAQRTIASTATSGTNTVSGSITHNDSVNNLRLYQATGGTLELTGVVSGQGSLWLDDEADGTFRLSADNSFSGGVYFDGGTLEIAHADALGTGTLEVGPAAGFARPATVDVNSGSPTITNAVAVNDQPGTYGVYIRNNGSGAVTYSGPWTINRGVDFENPGSGSLTLSGAVTLAGGTHDIITSNGNVTMSGSIGGSVGMTKKGSDRLTLSGVNTFSGATTVSAGTLLYSGTNTSSAVSVSGGAVLRGEGSIGALTVSDNAIVAAGTAASDVGTLTMTAMTLAAGGSNVVEMTDADGVKGTGWDLLAGGSGTLTVSATSGNPFVIALDDSGATGFTNTNTYAWVIIEGGAISGFAANKFSVDTDSFGPPLGGGSFSVGTNGTHDIVLNFNPPAAGEPSMGVGPASLSFNATLGDTPAAQTFAVTNIGAGTMLYTNAITYGSGSGWLTVLPTNGSLGEAASQVHTATVVQATAIWSHTATNTLTGNQTNGAKTVTVSYDVTAIANPTAVTAVTNSSEWSSQIDLSWTTAGYPVMIVRSTDASFDSPTGGVTYTTSSTIGGDDVIYIGSSPHTDTGLQPDTTYYYKLYSTNFSYYSSGVQTNETTGTDLGNAWHIPTNAEPPSVTMRNPTASPATNETVYFYNGNQFQGAGNTGNQTGGTLYHRISGGGGWSSSALSFDTQNGNNKYWVGNIAGDTYASGSAVEYYLKVSYSDHDDTYIGTTNSGVSSKTYALESQAQSNPFSFTYSGETVSSAAYMFHADNRVQQSSSSVDCWVKIGYAEGVGSNKWVDYASIYYTTNGVTPDGGYGAASNASTKVATMAFSHMEGDSYPDGDAMWWVGSLTNLPEYTTVKYKIGAWKTTEGIERFADYQAGTDDQTFSFALGVDTNGPILTVGTLNADYTTTKLFIDEIANDTEQVVVTFKPNAASVTNVEVFSNLDRRDYVDVDYTNAYITSDGYADGIKPPNGNLIGVSDTGSYFRAYTMTSIGGGEYAWTGTVSRCGAYRLTARYQTNGMAHTNFHWYTDTAAGRRDHAIVVSPKKVHELTMYELNTLTVEATDNTEAGRSTFVDLLGSADGDGDGYDHFNLDYLNFLQANCLWFQPIHPNANERGDAYTPGSPYSTRDYFAVTPYMGSNNTAAGAMTEFTNFVATCDSYTGSVGTVNVMLDGVFNHSSWDAEMGQGGVDLGYTGTATNRIGVVRPEFYSLLTDYGQEATYYNSSSDNNFATAPDRGDFGKWNDTADFFFGDYSALVRHNPENNGDYLNEGDVYDYDSMSTNQMDLWKFFAYYAEFWLDKTGHAGTNSFVQAEDDKGIDGLRCDFGQGLPPQAWEYIINRTRSKKWNFVFMAETLDGGNPGYRSNRHFDILNESLVFNFTQSHINDSWDLRSALEDRRNAYNGGTILLNLTSHDEVLPDNDAWITASRYGAVSSVDGVPMIFYGQEKGIQNYNSNPAYSHYDGFKTAHEENFGKYVPHFKQWNQLTVWTNAPPSSGGLDQWYGRVNWARLNSPALQSRNRYFLSRTSGSGGGDHPDILAVAKYETANGSPRSNDVVLAFALLLPHGSGHVSASATYDLQPAWPLLGMDTNKHYNIRNLASSDAFADVWSTNKTGAELYSDGIYIELLADQSGNNITNDGAIVQYLRLTEHDAPVATSYTVNAGADVYDNQVTGGTFSVVMDFRSMDGISTNTTSPFFAPNFDIFDVSGTQIVTDQVFSAFTHVGDGLTLRGSNASYTAIGEISGLGVYTCRWSAISSQEVSTIDSTLLQNGSNITFTVVDDDTVDPVMSDFVVWGSEGVSTVTVSELVSGSGWSITGLVHDADSGVNVNGSSTTQPDNSPYFVLYDPTGTPKLTNSFTFSFGDGEATSASAVSNAALGTMLVAPTGTWTARVVVADNDSDYGAADHEIGTSDVTFEVIGTDFPQSKDRVAASNPTSLVLGSTNVTLGAVTDTVYNELFRTNSQIRIKYNSGDLTSGYVAGPTNAIGYGSADTTAQSPQFTSTGTWYWAMEVWYGSSNFFYTTNSSVLVNMSAQPTNSVLQITVTNIPSPTAQSASATGPSSASVSWTQANGYNVMVVRRAGANPSAPPNGQVYTVGHVFGDGSEVVYAPGGGSSASDSGLLPQTTYHYGFYSENYGYYSPGVYATTLTGAGKIDGVMDEWIGTLPAVVNSATINANEFIWRDKEFEQREDPPFGQEENSDLHEFRVRADTTNVYFYVKLQKLSNVAYPYIAVGVDVDQNAGDSGMNWLADDSGTLLGDEYYPGGTAAVHYSERQMTLHNVDTVGQRIELHADDGSSWYAPPTHGDATLYFAPDTTNAIEWSVARSDINVSGTVTARFTVATFHNTNSTSYNNDADTTYGFNTCDAVDAISIPPYGANDGNLANYGAWSEDISDGDIDFFFDVRFDADGLGTNALPTAPDLSSTDQWVVSPTNNSAFEADKAVSFTWPASTDADDEVTSYLIEISSNSTFNGENATIAQRVNRPHDDRFHIVTEGFSAGTWYWRVRARDLSGMLSSSFTNTFTTGVADEDPDGPVALLVYIGTTYTPGATQTNITDADLFNTNDYLDIVVKWTDPSGVFLTNSVISNQTNIGSENGRVIPNWDLYTTNTMLNSENTYGFDTVFTNFGGNNGDSPVTTLYYNAFSITNSHFHDLYYLTVSAEDNDNDRGTYADTKDFGGGYGDRVPYDRTVTTNQLIQFTVTDNDAVAPVISVLAVKGDTSGSGTNLASDLVAGTWSITGLVQDVTSGVNTNGAVVTGNDIQPYVVLIDPLGVARLTNAFDSLSFGDGGAKASAGDLSHQSPSGMSGAYAMSGTWTARVVVADNDEHRIDDRTLGTNTVTFVVPSDSDNDDMDDGWEMSHLESLTPDGTGDKDGDGVLDEEEYISGTDPDNTNSLLQFVTMDLANETGNNVDITFEGGGFIEPGGYAGVAASQTRAFHVRSSDTYGGAKSSQGYRNGSLSATNVYTDTNAVIETGTRFYEISVTYEGKSYTNTREWAMHVQPRQQDKRYLVTVPVDYVYGSNALDSTLGLQISRGLKAGNQHNEPGADQIQFDDGLSFKTYTLVTNGSGEAEWWDGSGQSSRVVTPGEGFWVLRSNNAAPRTNMVFVGVTRTNNISAISITTNNMSVGWDAQIFGWPYSVSKSTSGATANPFGFVSAGAYGGSRSDTQGTHSQRGDQIWYWDDGWYYIWLVNDGAGPGPDNMWWDSVTKTYGELSLEPCRAYYYRHHVATNGPATGTNFNWQATLP